MEKKLTKKQQKVADVFDNKVYKTEDIKVHLSRKGYDRYLLDCFFDFLKDQVREAAEDEELINIQIRNFGSLFFSYNTYKRQKAKAHKRLEYEQKKGIDTKGSEELMKFLDEKYMNLRQMDANMKKSYNGSSKLQRKQKLYKDIHNDGRV